MFIQTVCQALKEADVPYAIVGGYAVALHGAVRGTIDIDFVIIWTLENLKKVETALKKLGLVSRLPITADNLFAFKDEYIQNKNLIAWNFYDPRNPSKQVDLIITYDLKNKTIATVSSADIPIKILSKEDLIAMKKTTGRKQDLEDIKALEELP